ncbi:MAG: phosphoenolpyruvate hydrolase family protein [Verrucomicrobia bacterium]|nr:phosphoenolpyruvate hydrolase family protein [Verrucomicrobiota bacterium]
MNDRDFLQKLLDDRRQGRPIICAGVGSGVTAKGAVEGGADLLAVYNTAVYRIMGLPTALAFLPYDDANRLTFDVLPQVMAASGRTPVLAGIGVHDPRVDLERVLTQVAGMGVAGVTNEPFIGIYSPDLRAHLEAAGLGFGREVSLVRQAVERNLLTLGWVFDASQAAAMTEAGAHLLGINLGLTTFGTNNPGHLDQAIGTLHEIIKAAQGVRRDIFTLIHGGPFNDPETVAAALRATGADGYVTGSTAEATPVRAAVADTIRRFRAGSTSSARKA